MDRAEFKVTREALGLSAAQVAVSVGVGPRAVRRWELGGSAIGDDAAQMLEEFARVTDREASRLAARARRMRRPRIVTYATDEAFVAGWPALAWQTARWHRAVAARAVRHVPGAVIVFAEDL